MTQCNSLNVKLSYSQLNKLKYAIKNETEGVLRLSSNMINLSKLWKTQLSKIIQLGEFLGRLLGPLLKTG